jgi:galactonate dehydratase
MAAIDIAIWDALGRRERKPVAALLAHEPAKSVPAYLSGLRRGSLTERVDLLTRLVAQGLPAVKIFVSNDTTETLAEIDALRSAVAGDWDLMVDALWSYEAVSDAAEARRAFGTRDVRWFECPLIPEDLEAHRELAAGAGVPIAIGEHFFTHYQSQPWFTAGTMSVFQPDMGRTGLSNGYRQAEMAREHGIAVTPHMGSGSPIVQATALQFWAATRPALPCEYQFDLTDVLPDAFDSGWSFANGSLPVPDRPGLGVAVDEDAIVAGSSIIERWCAN